jgi:hypothetical protein
VGALCVLAAPLAAALGQQAPATPPPADPIERLQRQLDGEPAPLRREAGRGYLRDVLRRLKIPISSQTLVFSQTSVQRGLISPQTPRAIYFNDDSYVAWIPYTPKLELATLDSQSGAVFYTLEQSAARPRFVRQTQACMECHSTTRTADMPSLLMRSMFVEPSGQPRYFNRNYHPTDASPWTERFGGWYVTGTYGGMRHLGNLLTRTIEEVDRPNLEAGANRTRLPGTVDPSLYLSPHSDVVALLVLQHQVNVHNRIARAGLETQTALDYERELGGTVERGSDGHTASTHRRIRQAAEPLVKALLFSGEAPLTAPVVGTSTFARDFGAGGPRDRRKRSLRELDLRRRLLRYPCSHLIYSEQFAALPPLARDYVFGRLREILAGRDTSGEFSHLSPTDRTALREILTDTLDKYELRGSKVESEPDRWRRPFGIASFEWKAGPIAAK